MSAQTSPRRPRPQPIVPEVIIRRGAAASGSGGGRGGPASLNAVGASNNAGASGGKKGNENNNKSSNDRNGLPCQLDQLLDGINRRKTEITQSLANLRFAAESTDSQSVCSLLSVSEWAAGNSIQNAEPDFYRNRHYHEGALEDQRAQLARMPSVAAPAAADDDDGSAGEDKKKRKEKKQQQQQQGNTSTAQPERPEEGLAKSSSLQAHSSAFNNKKEWKVPSYMNATSDAESACSTERRMMYSNRLRRRMASKKLKESGSSEARHRKSVSTAVQVNTMDSTREVNLEQGLKEALQIMDSIIKLGKSLEALTADSEVYDHDPNAFVEACHNESEQSQVHETNKPVFEYMTSRPEVLRLPRWDPLDHAQRGKDVVTSENNTNAPTEALNSSGQIDERLVITAAARDLVMKEFPDMFGQLFSLPRKFKM